MKKSTKEFMDKFGGVKQFAIISIDMLLERIKKEMAYCESQCFSMKCLYDDYKELTEMKKEVLAFRLKKRPSIDTSELFIGSWVRCCCSWDGKDTLDLPVSDIEDFGIGFKEKDGSICVYEEKMISGIELSYEWLLKFGFSSSDMASSKKVWKIKGRKNMFYITERDGIFSVLDKSVLTYVHQLQYAYQQTQFMPLLTKGQKID
jgi:hypothetical protein